MKTSRKTIAVLVCAIVAACLFVFVGCSSASSSGSSSSASSDSSAGSASQSSASASSEASSGSATTSSSAAASAASTEPADVGEGGVYVIKKSHLERGDGVVADATYNLDEHGNVESVDIVITGNDPDDASLVFKRDDNGFAESAGRKGGATMPYVAKFDDEGRLATLTGMNNFIRTFTYHDNNKLKTYNVTGGYQTSMTYDDNGYMTSITTSSESVYFTWDVDDNGHLTGGKIMDVVPVTVTNDAYGNPTQIVADTGKEVMYKVDIEYAGIAEPSQAARELSLNPTELFFGTDWQMFNLLVK